MSENQRFSDVFSGYRKGTLAWKGKIWFYYPQKHQRTLGHRNTQIDFNSLHFHAKFGDDPLLDLTIRVVKTIDYLFVPNIHHQMYLL